MTLIKAKHFWIKGSFNNPTTGILVDDGIIVQLLTELPTDQNALDVVDLGSAYVYPGFIDTHTHSFEGGLYSLMTDLSPARNIDDVLAMISATLDKPGEFLFAWNFDENSIAEGRFPTLDELNNVVSDRCLILRRLDGHSCMVNSYACRKMQDAQLAVKCENQNGIFKGLDHDRVVHWFQSHLDQETILEAYHAASDIALKGGFTTLHTMVGDANNSIGHFSLLKKHLRDFDIDYILYPQSFNIDAALEAGAERVGGCILADGSIGSYTAALYEPYQGTPIRGNLYQTDSFWREFISRAHRYNLQVAVHCIGDKAITQINSIYFELAKADYKDLRHQLIHCEITDDDIINHIKASAAVPVMQPVFDQLWGGDKGFYANRLGPERARIMNRFGSFTKKRVKITGSSDWYITPLNIAQSIHAAMHHHVPEERLQAHEAVDIYTRNAAWLSHDEQSFGEIETGNRADLTVLDTDFNNPFEYQNVHVQAVIKRGKVVHAAK